MIVESRNELETPNVQTRIIFQNRMYALRDDEKGNRTRRIVEHFYRKKAVEQWEKDVFAFLYEVKYATKEQLIKRFSLLTEENFDTKMNFWLEKRFVNAAVFANERVDFNNVKFKIYTISTAGIALLEFLASNMRDLVNWNPRGYLETWAGVKRKLLATDFRIKIETSESERLLCCNSNLLFVSGRLRMFADLQMFLNVSENPEEVELKPFLGLAITEDDFEYGNSTQINECIGRFQTMYENESWRTNFREPPTMLLIADSEKTVQHLQRLVEEYSALENFHHEIKNLSSEKFQDHTWIVNFSEFVKDSQNSMIWYDYDNVEWKPIQCAGFLKNK